MTLKETIEAFCSAVTAGDADAVRRMSASHAYHDSLSPEHLLRHVQRSGLGLVMGMRFKADDNHAAIEAAWYREDKLTGRTWLVFCRHNGQWQFSGRTDSDDVAHAYVHLAVDEAPTLDRWPADASVLALGQQCLAAAQGGEQPHRGELWDELLEPVEGDMGVRLGACAQQDALGRALVELEWFETDDPDFADTTRCGVFEQTDSGWSLIAVRYLAVCRSLLVGMTFASDLPENPELGMSGITSERLHDLT